MSIFIYTGSGYTNINKVKQIKHGSKVELKLYDENGDLIDDNNHSLHEAVISLTPVSGDWECLSPCTEEDGSTSAIYEPVMAWGLTALGVTVPITPSCPEGCHNNYALRKKGNDEVYTSSTTFGDAIQWLESYKKVA